MASKPKKKTPRKEVPVGDLNPATGEDRRGDTATVGWMLAMLATAAADALAAIAALVMPSVALSAEKPELALALPNLLLFVAAATGSVVILLTPVVYKFRRIPPPPPITAFGLVFSVLPILALLWRAVGNEP
jgi:hypothetical protein